MKNNVTDTLRKYSAGELTLEEANGKLKGSSLYLDPKKNVITEEEKRQTTVGYYPEQANGYGLLDSGTGTMDKVLVKNGRLVNCDMGSSYAIVLIAGRTYEVKGTKLVDKE